jgi:hypothetical protein
MPAIWDTWKDRFFERLVDLRLRFEQTRPHSRLHRSVCCCAVATGASRPRWRFCVGDSGSGERLCGCRR